MKRENHSKKIAEAAAKVLGWDKKPARLFQAEIYAYDPGAKAASYCTKSTIEMEIRPDGSKRFVREIRRQRVPLCQALL